MSRWRAWWYDGSFLSLCLGFHVDFNEISLDYIVWHCHDALIISTRYTVMTCSLFGIDLIAGRRVVQ